MARASQTLTLAALAMSGCAGPRATLPDACTGVPGDARDPNPQAAVAAATHGPGGRSVPEQMAVDRTPSAPREIPPGIPMLQVYDAAGAAASTLTAAHAALTDPLFAEIARSAFWGEVVGDHWYWVAEFGACAQTALLGDDFSSRAPAGGLLFVQYTAAGCEPRDKVTEAITRTLAANPALPARWLQFDMRSLPRRWRHSSYSFVKYGRWNGRPKDLQCLR